ncbi:nitrogen regulation protein NR(II) [Oceanicoccus sp. KOV_DT_Chl]|uniref:nitrogen regulation protein NR(II) n=1 Tax=Oceanicoccus sp. KOV_DT_Chl TaxID=1904639 RepID=UPI000C79A74B|nr:nitrogen regulation protein NR(II) [Oceanicoccus sp. KOV_DT_Chl]
MAPDSTQTDILDHLQTAILLIDADMTVSYINSAAQVLLKVSGNRVIGEPIDVLFHEKDGNQAQANLLSVMHNNNPFTKRETVLELPNGDAITVDCAVSPITEDNGSNALVMELQPLDRLLRISREEGLLSSQQNSQALIRGLAHEIKNPLGGLRGAAQLLARELPDESLADYTDIIIAEADRLSNLVNRMLGSHDLMDMQQLNIHEVLERVKKLVEVETGHSITITRDYDPSIPDLEGDKERLIQAVLNIVRNAMQALKNADIASPTITLKTRTLRQFTIGTHCHRLVCKVTISDNGPGIPKELLETIFLPMVSGHAEGTGLGLSISQSIITYHHGLIECNSEAGNTQFALYIPLDITPMEQQA